jgi:subtilase family serine protease
MQEDHMTRRALVVLATLALMAALPLATVNAASNGRSALKGSTPSWANAKNYKGAAKATDGVDFRVYLGWNHAAAAAATARAVSDPKSARYGQYLTPAQFRQQFSPSQAQVGAVKSWLKSQGFTVVYTPSNNKYVAAEGTVAQAAAAFDTSFGLYKVNGQLLRSQETSLSMPTSIASSVEGVLGLDESGKLLTFDNIVDKNNAPPTAGFRNSPPLSTYFGELVSPYAYPAGFTDRTDPDTAPWVVKGYTPAQVKGAYGITGGYDGSGQTVAIIDPFNSPTIVQDVNQWSINRGLPVLKNGQYAQIVPPGAYNRATNKRWNPRGAYTEQTLDVEAVHGMAPNANILFVGSSTFSQATDALMNHVVDKGLAHIVSNSYGFPTELLPPGYVKPMNDILLQGAAEGIGIYFSSGDFGDETSTLGFATVNWPASSPWVTSVGGTALAIGSDNSRIFETGWGTSSYSCNQTSLVCTRVGWTSGAGGGYSVVFPRPWYQDGFVSNAGRGVPDVGGLADPQTGYLIGQTQTFPDGVYYDEYRIGGTSLSTPIVAGLMALADQKAGSPHGFANPAFYENPSEFTDILSIKTAVARRNFVNGVSSAAGVADFLRTFDDYSGSPTQHTNPGWDDVTGLGSPNEIFNP